jgi:cytosine/adenosine deaminase-related metal-dependent hydrolase
MATTPTLIRTSGFVDAHSHLRSVALDSQGIGGTCLENALLQMSAMTNIDPTEDAFVASCQLLSAGVTGVQVVFHSFDPAEVYLEKLDSMISGAQSSGIRLLVILALTDQAEFLPHGSLKPNWLPAFTKPQRGISPVEFPNIVHLAVNHYPNISFGIGPVAPQWASDELLGCMGELSQEGLRFHTHLLESQRQRHWMRPDPVSRLMKFGLLHKNSSLAHGVWCQAQDLQRIRDSGAQMVTCPQSNILLNIVPAPAQDWLAQGIQVAVGMDSATSPPSPWANAREVLDSSQALRALTTGGMEATGLSCHQDDVTWSDFESGIVETVKINNHPVIAHGKLLNDTEYQASAERIINSMLADAPQRAERLHALETVFPKYLDYIDAPNHES